MSKMVVELAGRALCVRGFADCIVERGAKNAAKTLRKSGMGDLTNQESDTIDAIAALPIMRLILRLWWVAYDFHRKIGVIPDATAANSPWLP